MSASYAARSRRFARANDDVGVALLCCLEKPWQLRNRHRQVGVSKKSPGAAGLEHSPPDRRPLTAMWSADELDTCVPPRRFRDDRGRLIPAPIVHDDQLRVACHSIDFATDVVDSLRDAGRLVEGGHHEGQGRRPH